jgi:hypothetical protein
MAKLSQEDLGDLLSLVDEDGYQTLVGELEALVQVEERNLIVLNLDTSNQTELLVRKARAEGARRLFESFKRRIEGLKRPSSDVIAGGKHGRRKESRSNDR